MQDRCASWMFAIHDELETIADKSASLAFDNFGADALTDEGILRSAIVNTLMSGQMVPDAIMGEIVRHAREHIAERIKGGES